MKLITMFIMISISSLSLAQTNQEQINFRKKCHGKMAPLVESITEAFSQRRDEAIKFQQKSLGRPLTVEEVLEFAQFESDRLNETLEPIYEFCNRLIK